MSVPTMEELDNFCEESDDREFFAVQAGDPVHPEAVVLWRKNSAFKWEEGRCLLWNRGVESIVEYHTIEQASELLTKTDHNLS